MAINFDPLKNYTLEDDRVLLLPLKHNDIDYLLPFALNEPDTWKYFMVSAKGEERMRNFINTSLKAKEAGKEYPFIVFDKLTNEYAGCTRYYDIQPEYETLQIGYTWYGEKFRGTGLNKHCKFLLLQFAFEEIGVERVEFRADDRNEKSIAAMKSIGCKVEGILRSNVPIDTGGRRNSIILSILKSEWKSSVKHNLKQRISK